MRHRICCTSEAVSWSQTNSLRAKEEEEEEEEEEEAEEEKERKERSDADSLSLVIKNPPRYNTT